MHVMTIVAAEQQTMNFYMNHGTDWIEPIARGLYAEIALIEEQHVTHYESLLDPLDSWFTQWVFHEYNEVYLYWSMLQQESDRRIKAIWELHCNMEIGQLQVACDFMRRYEGVEPAEILPPVAARHAGDVRAQQGLRARGPRRPDRPADRRPRLRADRPTCPPTTGTSEYQEIVNAGGAPSEHVIDENRARTGREYRDETEGEHPVADLRPAGTPERRR